MGCGSGSAATPQPGFTVPSATLRQPGPQEEPQPRHIDDAELHLLADYTGERDLSKLREHVLAVWRRAISG